MIWIEIQIKLSAVDAERAQAAIHMAAPHGMYIEDYRELENDALKIAHINLIDDELLSKSKDEVIIHIYLGDEQSPEEVINFITERLGECGIMAEISSVPADDSDWADNWKKYFKPTPVGKRLLICPSWETTEPDGRILLTIDPGAAFGTGTHQTTRLCLEAIEAELRPGERVLDIGCGSGILAVAALLLGAERALLVDIDPQSVKTAAENLKINRVAQRAECVCGNLTEKVSGKYSVICANIVADAVIDLSREVKSFLLPGGRFICSGIIDSREDEVRAALTESGFEIKARLCDAGWIALVCTANN